MARSALLAALQQRCPRCRQGKLFLYPAWQYLRFASMHTHCPVCGLQYEVEVGFFWGAMYFTYAFTTALLIITYITLNLGFHDPDAWVYVVVLLAEIVVLLPWLVRYSRVAMLYLFGNVRYDPNHPHAGHS